MTTPAHINIAGLQDAAQVIVKACREHFPYNDMSNQQVLCLAEEVGEFINAYRRWSGQARRSGSFEDVKQELADVVISAFTAAEVLNIELDVEIPRKLTTILSRGWKEGRSAAEIYGLGEVP